MRTFDRIKAELGDPEIYYVEPRLFARLAWDIEDDYGGAEVVRGIRLVTVADWATGWARYGTLWHEVGHLIHQHPREWYARCWGYIMAHRRGGLGTAEYLYGHDPSELPCRRELLAEARQIVEGWR